MEPGSHCFHPSCFSSEPWTVTAWPFVPTISCLTWELQTSRQEGRLGFIWIHLAGPCSLEILNIEFGHCLFSLEKHDHSQHCYSQFSIILCRPAIWAVRNLGPTAWHHDGQVGYMPFAGSDERKQIHMIRSGTYLVKKERWAKVSRVCRNSRQIQRSGLEILGYACCPTSPPKSQKSRRLIPSHLL